MADLPDEQGKKPLTVSWSRLKDWEGCNQRGTFHMQGLGDTIKDGRRFIHGTLADRAMRAWLEQDDEQKPGQMAAYVDSLWDELVTNNPEYKIAWKGDPQKDMKKVRDLAKQVVNNVEPFLFKRVLPYDYHPELRFREPIRIPDQNNIARTLVLIGGMDIVTRDNDTGLVSIYDLKATTNENYINQGIMPQLIFYSIAWTYMHGTPAENIRAAFLTPACKKQYHPLEITSKERRYLMSRIVAFAHFVWSNEEPVCTTDKNECYFCDVKRHCPLWAPKVIESGSVGKNRVSISQTAKMRGKAIEQAK